MTLASGSFFLPILRTPFALWKMWPNSWMLNFFSLPFFSLSKCFSCSSIIKMKLTHQGKKTSKFPQRWLTTAPCPGSRHCSATAVHSSRPFLVAALCFWVRSLNSVMEITDHFVCLNPLGQVSPSQHPTGRRNEQRRKKSESLYFLPSLWKYYRCITLQAKPKCPGPH